MPKILTTEPDPGGQTCGYQIQIGGWDTSGDKFCGERKVRGLYHCQEHHDWLVQDEPDGRIRMAAGNAIGTG